MSSTPGGSKSWNWSLWPPRLALRLSKSCKSRTPIVGHQRWLPSRRTGVRILVRDPRGALAFGSDKTHQDICGFFMRDEPSYTPPQDLAKFLANGTQPVYIGFGSIVIDDPATMTYIIKEACRRVGARAIISRGWSKLGGNEPNTDSVYYLGDCPHGMSSHHSIIY